MIPSDVVVLLVVGITLVIVCNSPAQSGEGAKLAAAHARELQAKDFAEVLYSTADDLYAIGPCFKGHGLVRRAAFPLVDSRSPRGRKRLYGLITQDTSSFHLVNAKSRALVCTKKRDPNQMGANPYGSLVGPRGSEAVLLQEFWTGPGLSLHVLTPRSYLHTACVIPLEGIPDFEPISVAPVPGISRVLIAGAAALTDVDLAFQGENVRCIRNSTVQLPLPEACWGNEPFDDDTAPPVWRAHPLDERWAVLECGFKRRSIFEPTVESLYALDRRGGPGAALVDLGWAQARMGPLRGDSAVVSSVGADGMLIVAHSHEEVMFLRFTVGGSAPLWWSSRMSWSEFTGCRAPDCIYVDAAASMAFDVGDASQARVAVRFGAIWRACRGWRTSLAVVEWGAGGFARRLYHLEHKGQHLQMVFPSGVADRLLVEWATHEGGRFQGEASIREVRLRHNRTVISPAVAAEVGHVLGHVPS